MPKCDKILPCKMTGSSSKLSQIQCKWYRERKPKKLQTWGKNDPKTILHPHYLFIYIYIFIYICWLLICFFPLGWRSSPAAHLYFSSLLQWLALLDHVLYVYPQVLTVWNGWTWRPLGKGSRMDHFRPFDFLCISLRSWIHGYHYQ